jgi:hypothetical protein
MVIEYKVKISFRYGSIKLIKIIEPKRSINKEYFNYLKTINPAISTFCFYIKKCVLNEVAILLW